MKLSAKIRRIGTRMMLFCALFLAAACDSAIYDYEGDCSVTYRLRFRYDMNMKFADAFAQEVGSVSVYAFNTDGVLVWQKSEKGEKLKAEDYAMTLELPKGKYDLVAWCGLDNTEGTRGGDQESFRVPPMQMGASTKEQLICTLNRKRTEAGQAYTDENLYGLYHGTVETVDIIDEDDPEAIPGVYDIEMPLVKNTNHVRVILQNLSGQHLDAEDFSFTIEDNNGVMNCDNSLMDDESITYRHWNRFSGSAGIAPGEEEAADGTITSVNAAVADLTVARMMTDHRMMLTIRNERDDKVVARVPLTDYALLIKENYGRPMSAQEYLDRQDEYALTFFLDDSNNWLSAFIYINSWRVVLNNVDLE